jgi:hypothetical protein
MPRMASSRREKSRAPNLGGSTGRKACALKEQSELISVKDGGCSAALSCLGNSFGVSDTSLPLSLPLSLPSPRRRRSRLLNRCRPPLPFEFY